MSNKPRILLNECKSDFLRSMMHWRGLWDKDKNNKETYQQMAKFACLVDLIERLTKSVRGNKP